MQGSLNDSFREAQKLGAETLLLKAYGELQDAECKDIRPRFSESSSLRRCNIIIATTRKLLI